ncbi:MAG TPA: hypothetical protein VFN76_09795 [Candidatus Limnocylindria bacterium]|nr:hypothetical protein [Candidatus Limnocylindria bacterium]
MSGSLSVLNVGAGDIRIDFTGADEMEKIRAKRIISDMLRRGYALFVKLADGTYRRALRFDPEAEVYVIADLDTEAADASDGDQEATSTAGAPSGVDTAGGAAPGTRLVGGRGRRGRRRVERKVPMGEADAIGVHQSAGG